MFDATTVAEIAAGYFWDPASASGLGGVGFKIPEGNGHSTFDLVQATVSSQPTALSENGAVQYRMRKSVDANPSILGSSGAVQAGWTGPTYVGGWFRLPDASGDITGAGNLFVHTPTAAGQRRLSFQLISGSPDLIRPSVSTDGTTTPTSSYANAMIGAAWIWLEMMFDPGLTLGGSTVADYLKFFADFVAQTRTGNSGTNISTLFNGNAPISVASRAATSLANTDTTDFGPLYYGNGIPSLANRKRLRNRHRPVAAAV